MVSKTSICNKALIKLGVDPVINIDTDTSPQATRCKATYDDSLEEVLRVHNWNFAIFRQSLNQDTSITPAYGYTKAFVLPTVPKLIRIIEEKNNIDYKIENNLLLTNESSVSIRFVGRETDPNKYDSLFVEILALRIAVEIGFKLTGNASLIQLLEQKYQLELSNARSRDFQEDNQKPLRVSSFNQSRLVSYDQIETFAPVTQST